MPVEIVELPDRPVLFVRRKGMYQNSFSRAAGEAWQVLNRIVWSRNLVTPTTLFIGTFHPDAGGVPPEERAYDACITVDPGAMRTVEELRERMLPGGRYALFEHQGSYERLPDAWSRVIGYCRTDRECRLRSAPCYERYVNNPNVTPVADLRTELYVPVI